MQTNTFRALRLTLLCAAVCAVFAGCSTQKTVSIPIVEPPKADTTLLPAFSGEALYVLGKEWEAVYDSTSAKYHTPQAAQLRADSVGMSEYIEQRLTELYPEKAYKGYFNKIEQICTNLLQQQMQDPHIKNDIQAELPSEELFSSYDEQFFSDSYINSDSVYTTEEALMEFTPAEQERYDLLNHIAEQQEWATRTDLDSLQITAFAEEDLLSSVLLWHGANTFFRILQSKVRAEQLAAYYYGEDTKNGKPGDAFKHIYVNVLLRSYTNRAMAWLVMDMYWENAHKNAPCDHFMDLHNNVIGRSSRYKDFICTSSGEQCGSTRQWLLWAEQVQHFVQDSTNGEYQRWDKETPTLTVKPAAEKVQDIHYIYWDK